MSFQVPPAIAGIIIGAILIIIGVAVLNGSQFIPQVWSVAWVGVILIVTGILIAGVTIYLIFQDSG